MGRQAPSDSLLSSSSARELTERNIVVTIPSMETRSGAGRDGKEKFTMYCVTVSIDGGKLGEWSVYRRYSQFLALHKSLNPDIRIDLKLPPKRIHGNFDRKFLAARKEALETYLTVLLAVENIFYEAPDVRSFLGMNLHMNAITGRQNGGQRKPQNKNLTEFNWVHRTGGIPASALRSAAANRRDHTSSKSRNGSSKVGTARNENNACIIL